MSYIQAVDLWQNFAILAKFNRFSVLHRLYEEYYEPIKK